ncbi:hypothetical protein COLO4_04369 [Corchorus olitorius]|uniref:Protein kinase domain-containing protein n=1 Tax=Corchorus olitorius TaxID=93759 RepID=A0A1R3KUA4_9ROSI|nr:hypothetical protein COLO4_04369 [Corchorus olitorius]
MDLLQHFSHRHPLVFNQDQSQGSDQKAYCSGCGELVRGPSFSCVACGFYLDEKCAKASLELNHPFHPNHSFELLEKHPYKKGTTTFSNVERVSVKLVVLPTPVIYAKTVIAFHVHHCQICSNGKDMNTLSSFFSIIECCVMLVANLQHIHTDARAHVDCVLGKYSFIKLGSIYKKGDHPHHLTFVKKVYYYPECNKCGFGRITGLKMFLAQNNQLTGEIPEFDFDNLDQFNVSNNLFKGPIPADANRFPASCFLGNPGLCGDILQIKCPPKKKKLLSKDQILMYSGYAALALVIIVALIIVFCLKKKKVEKVEAPSPKNKVASVDDVVVDKTSILTSTEFKTDISRSEFSVNSESALVSSSLVVLTSPTISDLKFEDLLRAPAELIGIPRGQNFDWASRLDVAAKIAEALAFMHRELQGDGIAHGNLKSSNIMLKENMEPCISEYGLMTVDPQESSLESNGNSLIAAQKTKDSASNAFKADIYCFGVILLELLTGRLVQSEGVELTSWVQSVVREEWTVEVFDKSLISEVASEERMLNLLQVAIKCINISPEARPSIDQVVAMINTLKEEEDKSLILYEP